MIAKRDRVRHTGGVGIKNATLAGSLERDVDLTARASPRESERESEGESEGERERGRESQRESQREERERERERERPAGQRRWLRSCC